MGLLPSAGHVFCGGGAAIDLQTLQLGGGGRQYPATRSVTLLRIHCRFTLPQVSESHVPTHLHPLPG